MRGHSAPGWQALVLHADDNVAVALRDLNEDEEIHARLGGASTGIRTLHRIPLGHKMALRALAVGTEIRKYGEVIGAATTRIEPGAHVHIHNMKSLRARRPT